MRLLAVIGVVLMVAAVVLAAVGVGRWFYRKTMTPLWEEREQRRTAEFALLKIEQALVQAPNDPHVDEALRRIYEYNDTTTKKELA